MVLCIRIIVNLHPLLFIQLFKAIDIIMIIEEIHIYFHHYCQILTYYKNYHNIHFGILIKFVNSTNFIFSLRELFIYLHDFSFQESYLLNNH